MARYFFSMKEMKIANEIMIPENKFNFDECVKQGYLIASRNKRKTVKTQQN